MVSFGTTDESQVLSRLRLNCFLNTQAPSAKPTGLFLCAEYMRLFFTKFKLKVPEPMLKAGTEVW